MSGKLKCEICGQYFKGLGSHIKKHGMSASEYKRKFGIIQKKSLTTGRNYSDAIRKRFVEIGKSSVQIMMRKNRQYTRHFVPAICGLLQEETFNTTDIKGNSLRVKCF